MARPEGRTDGEAPQPRRRLHILLRLLRFQIKLLFDGVRDVVLSPISIGVVVIGWLLGREQRYFDALMRLGERSDDWLNLFETRQLRDLPIMGADDLLDDVFSTLGERARTPFRGPVPLPKDAGESADAPVVHEAPGTPDETAADTPANP